MTKQTVVKPTPISIVLLNKYRKLWQSIARSNNEALQKLFFDQLIHITEPSVKIVDQHFNEVEEEIKKKNNFYKPFVYKQLLAMKKRNASKTYELLKAALKIDLKNILESEKIKEAFLATVESNFNLISTLSSRQLNRLKASVLADLQFGKFSAGKIKTMLEKDFAMSERHARFIATDQTHKLNSSLNILRYQQLGSVKYEWRNMGDTLVRGNPDGKYPKAKPSHWAREGKVYYYDNPPARGNPGEDFNCRCQAAPIFNLIR